jgi:hypothetical protein
VEYIIRFFEALPWEISTLLSWTVNAFCFVWLFKRLGKIPRNLPAQVAAREERIPLALVEKTLVDIDANSHLARENARGILDHEGRIGRAERRQTEQERRLLDVIRENREEHKQMLGELSTISSDMSEIKGWIRGKANGLKD